MIVLRWLNDQVLKMEWLAVLVERLVVSVFGLDVTSGLGGSIHFFIYDTVKIFLLLSALIFGISYIQSYFPPERTRRILGRFDGIGANLLGALMGTITPFCSCSSIPIFIGFINAGLPIGVTFSFLISSPLVDLASILLLASILNWKIASAYVVVGILLAVTGGSIISKLKLEKYIEPFVYNIEVAATSPADFTLFRMTSRERIEFAHAQVKDIVHRVWLYVLIGVGVGAAIHNWIPESAITALLGEKNAFSVVLATVAGLPMYADIFGTLPIAEALVAKGVGIGTVLTFMMAVTATSLPSLILLKKVVKARLLAVFVGVVTFGIIIIGYIFNALGYRFI
ncbi:MAG: permease [Firmicutes bacterium]|nr:permease [Bacillota bacterium]